MVLSNEAFAAIETMNRLETAGTSSAGSYRSSWMRSVWTYQEVINSRDLLFTGESMAGNFIRGEDASGTTSKPGNDGSPFEKISLF